LPSFDSPKAAYMLLENLLLPWVLKTSFGAFFRDLLNYRLVVVAAGLQMP
jgi:hypothetical protein